MHAIIKVKKRTHVEIQNDFQNIFRFLIIFTVYELMAHIDVRYGDTYPEKKY